MNSKINIVFSIISSIIIFVVSLLFGCKSETPVQPEPVYNVPKDKYIFIEHHVYVDGIIIEGEYVGPFIDFPTYMFDLPSGILFSLIEFSTGDNFIGIYGNGISLCGSAGDGASTALNGIYHLPYRENMLTLKAISDSAAVTILYKDSLMVLAPNEEYKSITSRLDTSETGVALLTTTDYIINYGLQAKSKIYKWEE